MIFPRSMSYCALFKAAYTQREGPFSTKHVLKTPRALKIMPNFTLYPRSMRYCAHLKARNIPGGTGAFYLSTGSKNLLP
jgi:hypothetical protein